MIALCRALQCLADMRSPGPITCQESGCTGCSAQRVGEILTDGCFEEVFKEQGSTGDTTEVVILQAIRACIYTVTVLRTDQSVRYYIQ